MNYSMFQVIGSSGLPCKLAPNRVVVENGYALEFVRNMIDLVVWEKNLMKQNATQSRALVRMCNVLQNLRHLKS